VKYSKKSDAISKSSSRTITRLGGGSGSGGAEREGEEWREAPSGGLNA
jgi:hypothetical protein